MNREWGTDKTAAGAHVVTAERIEQWCLSRPLEERATIFGRRIHDLWYGEKTGEGGVKAVQAAGQAREEHVGPGQGIVAKAKTRASIKNSTDCCFQQAKKDPKKEKFDTAGVLLVVPCS